MRARRFGFNISNSKPVIARLDRAIQYAAAYRLEHDRL